MSMDFAQAMRKQTNQVKTENGAVAYRSTDVSYVLDLYATAGALRTRNMDEIAAKFALAFKENPLLALRLAFYTGDIRGGLGERRTFRTMLRWLAVNAPEAIGKNVGFVPEFNRWDSLYELVGTPAESFAKNLIREQFLEDLQNMRANKPISIMAKWLKSANGSAENTRALGIWTANNLHLSEKQYRKALSAMRSYLQVLETKMSRGDWLSVVYSAVPSRAMMRYRKLFIRKDNARFSKYLESLKKGEAKINASTLYPYDIVEKFLTYGRYFSNAGLSADETVLAEQWKALPNYIEGENNIVVMADVSGSMAGRPIATSIGLAMYFAERNNGPYKDMFMTFSNRPVFVRLQGDNIKERILNLSRAQWDMNTNLGAAFAKVLETAVQNNVAPKDMPKAIVVISDMEIDSASRANWDFYSTVELSYNQYGYKVPNLVFWNVNSRNDTFLVDGNRRGVQLVSGSATSTFKNVLDAIGLDPYQAMLKTLNAERYAGISL